MSLDWLPGVTRLVIGPDAGAYLPAPFRVVLHRTEGGSIEGAVAAYRGPNFAPHVTVDIKRRQAVQHIAFSRAARSLENRPGGVETNRLSCLQFEIVGFSHDSHLDADADLAWMGATILAPVMAAYGVKATAPPFYGEDCGWTLASAAAKQRMSFNAWVSFNGVCAHQHVPEQTHWDCGALRIATVLAAVSTPPPTAEDDEMTPEDKAQLNRVEAMCWQILRQHGGNFDAATGQIAWQGWPALGIATIAQAVSEIKKKLGA